MNIYQQNILDHFKNPRHKGVLSGATYCDTGKNHSCGDYITFYVEVDNNYITNIMFDGSGCAISQATASMLAENCIKRSVDDICNLTKDDIIAMLNIPLGPVRLKCALLPLEVLQKALINK